MSRTGQHPIENPRLGTIFSIFTSALVAAMILLIIFERLGLDRFWLSHIACVAPLVFAAAIAVFSATNKAGDIYVSGRRVPPSFTGFNLAITALGGTGLLSLTGLFFLIGFDAAALSLGWCLGFVFMALLYAPHIRRAESYSLPGYFSNRFNSKLVGAVAAVLILPPVLMVLIAELKVGVFAAYLVTGLPQEYILAGLTTLILLMLIPGGMRSLTWSGAANFIILLIGILLPLFIVSIYVTNLPLPQITYGSLLNDQTRFEITNGLAETSPLPLSEALGHEHPQQITHLFLQTFGALSEPTFVMLLICILCGVSTFPTLLMRTNTTINPNAARRSAGWGLALLGILLISAPAYAVFVKFMIFENLIGATIDQLPDWARDLINLRLIEIRDQDQNVSLGLNELYVSRDGLTFILPIIAGLPFALIVLSVTSALAASTAAAAGHTFAMTSSLVRALSSTSLSEDTFYRSNHLTIRLAIVVTTIIGALAASLLVTQPLWLLIWALSISASTFFAPLTLAVFRRDFSANAAILSMIVGAAASTLYILFTPQGQEGLISGISHLVPGIIAIPASFTAGMVLTMLSPRNANTNLETDADTNRQYDLRQPHRP